MKASRQMRILEIIRDYAVSTQEELVRLLRASGMDVTQATVSRDIKEMRLIKVPSGEGGYRYAVAADQPSNAQYERLRRIFRECLVAVENAENIVVVRSLPGTGSAMGEAVDSLQWSEIVGSVAGDNTVLVVARDAGSAMSVAERLQNLMQ